MKRLLTLLPVLALAACAQQTARAPGPRPSAPARLAPVQEAPPDYANLTGPALRRVLGQPAFVRQDGPTQLWRYDGINCRAFFFLNGTRGTETVRHVETMPRGRNAPADPACLNALRAAHQPSPPVS